MSDLATFERLCAEVERIRNLTAGDVKQLAEQVLALANCLHAFEVGSRVVIHADELGQYVGERGVVDEIRAPLFTKAGKLVAGTHFCLSIRFDRPVLGSLGRWCSPNDVELY